MLSGTLYPPIHPGEVLMEDFIKGFVLVIALVFTFSLSARKAGSH